MGKIKGQLILKAIYGLLTSPKKRTDEFVLFAFLLFMANKSNLSVCFFWRIYGLQICFLKLTILYQTHFYYILICNIRECFIIQSTHFYKNNELHLVPA